jgi:hypothetical protein
MSTFGGIQNFVTVRKRQDNEMCEGFRYFSRLVRLAESPLGAVPGCRLVRFCLPVSQDGEESERQLFSYLATSNRLPAIRSAKR